MTDAKTIEQNRLDIIEFHQQSLALWKEGGKTLQDDSDRNFAKIKQGAREMSKLMTDQSIVAIAHAISRNRNPESVGNEDPDKIDTYLQVLRRQFVPILDIIATMKPPSTKNVPLDQVRRFTISLFFEYCWDKHDRPTEADFIEACTALLNDAGDAVDSPAVADIVKMMPEHLFPFSTAKQKFIASLFH